jgi:hypothetical protein
MSPPVTYIPSAEFLVANEKGMMRLRRMYPGRSDRDLAFALQQAQGLAEDGNLSRVLAAASILLQGHSVTRAVPARRWVLRWPIPLRVKWDQSPH